MNVYEEQYQIYGAGYKQIYMSRARQPAVSQQIVDYNNIFKLDRQ